MSETFEIDFSRYAILSDLVDLTDSEVNLYILLLYQCLGFSIKQSMRDGITGHTLKL